MLSAAPPTYRLADLGRVPCLLSLARLPLAGLFVSALGDPRVALAILALSGLTDVLDGWWARRFGQSSALGALVDGITDKVFVLAVVLGLLGAARLTVPEVLLLGARELGEFVLLSILLARRGIGTPTAEPRADLYGKATTLLQFVAVALALFGHPLRGPVTWAAGVLGLFAAGHYAHRMLAGARP